MAKVCDYVEDLENIKDDEQVLFDIGLSVCSDKDIESILTENGLMVGKETDEWFVRKENANTTDQGRVEIFTPVMTAKDAKEIMPKIIKELDDANVTSSLILPMKAKDVFKENEKPDQEKTSQELDKFMKGVYIRVCIQEDEKQPEFLRADYSGPMNDLGFRSKEDLPEVYTSFQQLKEKFPKEKYLFSGSTASDDYCVLSARVGRNGTIYATPDIEYAGNYTGVVDVGMGNDKKATGEKYVSSKIGECFGSEVRLGFINVYEQNEKDTFYGNFGIEEYRQNLRSKAKNGAQESKEYPAANFNEQGIAQDAHRKIVAQSGATLTRDQAVNGYLYGNTTLMINGKEYASIYTHSESYITKEKNPIKAKIMCVQWKNDTGKNMLFIPIKPYQEEMISHILSSRRANMKETFSVNGREDIYQRFMKQKEEFIQGISRPMNLNVKSAEQQEKSVVLSNDDKLAALSGRPAPSEIKEKQEGMKAAVVQKVQEKPSLKNMFQKAAKSVKSKFEKPKEKTAEEKAKDKKAYRIVQTLRGILQPKKSKKAPESAKVLTNEQTTALQMSQQKEGGR